MLLILKDGSKMQISGLCKDEEIEEVRIDTLEKFGCKGWYFSYYCCVTSQSKLGGSNQELFYYAHGFCGSRIWQVTAGWLVSVSQCLESQLGRLKWLGVTWTAGNWNHPEVSSLTDLAPKLRLKTRLSCACHLEHCAWPLHVTWLLAAWWLGSEREYPQEGVFQEN